MSSNLAHSEVYSIKHYVIVCQWFVAGRWVSSSTPISAINKSNRQDIAEILLKVALSTISITLLLNALNVQVKYDFHNGVRYSLGVIPLTNR